MRQRWSSHRIWTYSDSTVIISWMVRKRVPSRLPRIMRFGGWFLKHYNVSALADYLLINWITLGYSVSISMHDMNDLVAHPRPPAVPLFRPQTRARTSNFHLCTDSSALIDEDTYSQVSPIDYWIRGSMGSRRRKRGCPTLQKLVARFTALWLAKSVGISMDG